MNRYITTCLLLISLFISPAYAQQDSLAAGKIPAALLNGANAVLRYTATDIDIITPTDIFVTYDYTITVLNEKGSHYAEIDQRYDKLISVRSIEGTLYDKNGLEISTLKKKMIKDFMGSTSAFFDDERSKKFQFTTTEYPYTCNYTIVRHYLTSFNLPSWIPQIGPDVSVEHATVTVTYPAQMAMQHKEYRTNNKPVLTTDGGRKHLTLNVNSIPAFKMPDELTPIEIFYAPAMVFLPQKVTVGEFSGEISTWNKFGAFVYDLNSERDDLDQTTVAYVHKLTDTCASAAAKVRVLYEYLQQNTRYVNISLGIGGWQVHNASFVAGNGYGDCKDLSNYMKAMLNVVGVPSYMALIYGGEHYARRLDDSFPFQVFNHAILCVPGVNDTTWLDCTSKTDVSSYLSDFTNNRKALLLTPTGGYVVKTPKYDHSLSKIARCARININEKDEFTGSLNTYHSGSYWAAARRVLDNGKESNDKYYSSKFAMSTYTVNNYNFTSGEDNGIPNIREHIDLSGSGFVSHGGNRLFISPRVFSFFVANPNNYEDNKEAFETAFDGDCDDTTIINLTGTYEAERLPAEINIELPSGNYHAKTTFEDGHIIKIIVHCTEISGVYPGTIYADYKKLSKAIKLNQAYDKIILKKKN
ncbi:hypothetical protein CJD36_001610 [Flavipsychrobacter stenotrophus]|uniref:DUF3857 domain-containing protein n=1 Tax=Flavipsychrobacter stenotrophus TaxID=2077091 RepID=A0A2S7T0R0_9BACT|nr:DUF3857 domain-containing protein [Flavipsychrobacter stenotrophus]PQJ12471.1 hypothetical protein CJD36_001610 [Flavipsychrobacter stenotrophus]